MDTNGRTNTASAQISKVDKIYQEKNKGDNAKLVLAVLDPILERRLGLLLASFRQAPPELGALLDFRAQICEVWYLRKELADAVSHGKLAEGVLEQMMLTLAQKRTNGDASGYRTGYTPDKQ